MKYLITLFFLLFLFCPEIKAQRNLSDNGELWVVMSDTEKNLYIKGFNAGFEEGASALDILTIWKIVDPYITSLGREEKNSLRDKLFKYVVNTTTSDKETNAQPETITNEQIVKQMNIFYKDPQNRKIEMFRMRRFALYKLKGWDVSDSILESRKLVNELLQLQKR